MKVEFKVEIDLGDDWGNLTKEQITDWIKYNCGINGSLLNTNPLIDVTFVDFDPQFVKLNEIEIK